MDLDRMKALAGIPLTEATMAPEKQLAALQAQYKAEVDSRARSVLADQIKKLKAKIEAS